MQDDAPDGQQTGGDAVTGAGGGTVVEQRELTAADHAERFAGFARAARGTATQAKAKGDAYGEQLAAARAAAYDQAAEIARTRPLAEAAEEMMATAGRMHVRNAPLMDFDNAGLQYIASRAWQYCASQIDPSLPEVAPKWE